MKVELDVNSDLADSLIVLWLKETRECVKHNASIHEEDKETDKEVLKAIDVLLDFCTPQQ